MSFVLLSKKEAHLQALFSDDFILDFHDPKIHARNKLHETFLHYFTNFSAIFWIIFQRGACCKMTTIWPKWRKPIVRRLQSCFRNPYYPPFENSVHHYNILSQHQNLPWLIIFWCLGHKHNRESVCFVL